MSDEKKIEARNFLIEEVRKTVDMNVRPEQPVQMVESDDEDSFLPKKKTKGS